jgi:hypothetical protein
MKTPNEKSTKPRPKTSKLMISSNNIRQQLPPSSSSPLFIQPKNPSSSLFTTNNANKIKIPKLTSNKNRPKILPNSAKKLSNTRQPDQVPLIHFIPINSSSLNPQNSTEIQAPSLPLFPDGKLLIFSLNNNHNTNSNPNLHMNNNDAQRPLSINESNSNTSLLTLANNTIKQNQLLINSLNPNQQQNINSKAGSSLYFNQQQNFLNQISNLFTSNNNNNNNNYNNPSLSSPRQDQSFIAPDSTTYLNKPTFDDSQNKKILDGLKVKGPKIQKKTKEETHVSSNANGEQKKGRGRPRLFSIDPVTGQLIRNPVTSKKDAEKNKMLVVDTSAFTTTEKMDIDDSESSSSFTLEDPSILLANCSFENKPKPKVLTHVIEDFIIKECSIPFDQATEEQNSSENCNICLECNSHANRNKNFCSKQCVKLFKKKNKSAKNSQNLINKPLKVKLNLNRSKNGVKSLKNLNNLPSNDFNLVLSDFTIKPINNSTNLELKPALINDVTPTDSNNNTSSECIKPQFPPGEPTEWTCDQVYEFVSTIAGKEIGEVFRAQDLDGAALDLLKDDHLMSTLHIKLGPALKIMSKFNELKKKFKQQN